MGGILCCISASSWEVRQFLAMAADALAVIPRALRRQLGADWQAGAAIKGPA